MIIIAESGSTKCDWAQCTKKGDLLETYQTIGFNPKYTSCKSMLNELSKIKLNKIKHLVTEVFFYGAGCSSIEKNKIIKKPLSLFFSNAKINIKHDLDAAIKATYDGSPMICCILGTGSNSCIYNGQEIIKNGPSLGYILGDEASGNYFGKRLINLYVNKRLPESIIKKFQRWTNEREEEIIQKIYTSQKPNLYLASFFPFIYQNKNEKVFDQMIKDGIQCFFNIHIKCFKDHIKYPITFVGSVAFLLSDYIHKIAKQEQLSINKIVKSPIYKLIETHFNTN
tara:strand:- start:12 stop:857 length:846 start_codon:yes stop_codon:yes gene_type:complete